MKPDWDRLMEEFKDSPSALVGDVDCTVEEDLCGKHGVEGYPTIKYGDPADLQDYQGGRDYEDLEAFAKENLGPVCGPKNIDLCDEQQRKAITEAQALSDEALIKKIKEKEGAVEAEEKRFNDEVEALQAKYEEMIKAKDVKVAELKKGGLGVLMAVCTDRPSCTPPTPAPPPGEDGGGEDYEEGEDFGEDEDMEDFGDGDDADEEKEL